MTNIWIVVKCWPGGKQEVAAAYRGEQNARMAAAALVGVDGALIALQTTTLKDDEPAKV